jgi:hypothetical protein
MMMVREGVMSMEMVIDVCPNLEAEALIYKSIMMNMMMREIYPDPEVEGQVVM